MSDLRGKRIAAYGRMSTDKQNPTSATDQIAKCAAAIALRGGAVNPALVFRDDAISGAVRERPGILALLASIDRGEVDIVVVEDLSRLSRDTEDSAWIRRRIPRLIALDNGIDTANEGAAFTADIFAAVAAQLRRDIGKKTVRGMTARAQGGFVTGGALAFGYCRMPGTGGSTIAIDEARGAVVRDIFAAYASGHSLGGVAAMLNARGIEAPRTSKPRDRDAWGVSTVRAILHNEKYVGRWTFGRLKWDRDPETRRRRKTTRTEALVTTDRPDLAIIDAATAERVRARFAETTTTYARKGRRVPLPRRVTFPLSGLLRCAHCGELMSIGGGEKGRRYYVCTASRRGTCGFRRYVRESVIRDGVIARVRQIYGSPAGRALLCELITEAMAEVQVAGGARRDLSARIEKNEARSRRLTMALADGDAPDSVLATLREMQAQIRADRGTMERLEAMPQTIATPTPAEVLAGVSAALDGEPDVVRHQLRGLLDGGHLDVHEEADGSVNVRGALDLGVLLGPERRTAPSVVEGCRHDGCGGRI